MTITALELARLCGVSRGTVDRALMGRAGIHPATRDRVLALAAEHGYRPNPIGRALVSGRTMMLGAVLPDFEEGYAEALAETAAELGYDLLVLPSHGEPERERECLLRLAARRVDGVLLRPVGRGEEFCGWLRQLRVPAVALINRLADDFPFAGYDDRGGAAQAVRHLAGQGRRRVHYYAPALRQRGTINLFAQEERLAGYREALAADAALSGEAVESRLGLLSLLAAEEEAGEAAVLCAGDAVALDVQAELRRRLPQRADRVRLMGLDGSDWRKYGLPPLAAVRFDRGELVRAGLTQMQRLLAGETPAAIVVPGRIVDAE